MNFKYIVSSKEGFFKVHYNMNDAIDYVISLYQGNEIAVLVSVPRETTDQAVGRMLVDAYSFRKEVKEKLLAGAYDVPVLASSGPGMDVAILPDPLRKVYKDDEGNTIVEHLEEGDDDESC